MDNWGGKRLGAGRPKGSTNKIKKPTRKNRTITAFDDEWEDIKLVARVLKKNKDHREKIMDLVKSLTKE